MARLQQSEMFAAWTPRKEVLSCSCVRFSSSFVIICNPPDKVSITVSLRMWNAHPVTLVLHSESRSYEPAADMNACLSSFRTK